jgi:flagellar basal body rod protein FlgG
MLNVQIITIGCGALSTANQNLEHISNGLSNQLIDGFGRQLVNYQHISMRYKIKYIGRNIFTLVFNR